VCGTFASERGRSGQRRAPAPRKVCARMAIDPDRLAEQVRRFEHGSRVPGWDDAVDLDKDPAPIPDPATTPVPEQLRAQIEGLMTRYPDRRSAAIPALMAAQELHGWLSPTAVEQVATVMRLTPGYLIAVATFYDMFETRPVGRHTVYVCTNISCSLRGGDKIYARMQDAAGDDPDFNVRSFECLGACDIAPMASVGNVYVGPLEEDDCVRLVDDLRAGRSPLADKQLTKRPLAEELPVGTGQPGAGGDSAEGVTASGNDATQDRRREGTYDDPGDQDA
jgi:NADH-quinone oxidoreductase subunit E